MRPPQIDLTDVAFSSLSFSVVPLTSLSLPRYKGSTFRGAFGSTLRQIACIAHDRDCQECADQAGCVYHYVFETPPPPDTEVMRKYPYVPHPFVIEPPEGGRSEYTREDTLSFGLKLVGKAADYLPYFVHTFDEMGRIGIGRGRGKYRLAAIHSDTQQGERLLLYDGGTKTLSGSCPRLHVNGQAFNKPVQQIAIEFLTPTRIKYEGRLVLDLDFHVLIRSLLRRVSMLSYFHCGIPLDLDYAVLINYAEQVRTVRRGLVWFDWKRYSARQDQKMSLGGFVGPIHFEGDATPFMPLLTIGEHLHAGKGTSFGLGRYRILDKGEHEQR